MSGNTRECLLMVVTGTKGVGKTVQTHKELQSYIMNDPSKGRKGRKVLIFDTNGEPIYATYKTVHFDITPLNDYDPEDKSRIESKVADNIKKLASVEIRRVSQFKVDGSEMSIDEKMITAGVLLRNFRSGLLLLEDTNNYIVGIQSKDLISSITTNRHRNQDVVVHLQSLSAIHTRLWQNADIVRIHHQADPFKKIKERCNNYEIMEIIEILVNHQYHNGNKYFFIYYYNHKNKFKIPFGTKKQQKAIFDHACQQYVLNNNTIKNSLMKEIDLHGKKKYVNLQGAVNEFIRRKQDYLM